MSRRGPEINFNPLLQKVQHDINILCYLGLHQYAKENNLIGRSRPMITKDLDFVKQKRLNFRLTVACIQQIIGSKTMNHSGREEQINYVNVGEYSALRLYGLLDKEMFAIYVTENNCITGYWPNQIAYADIEMLASHRPLKAFEQDLSYNTRATLEVGGHIFTEKLRKALKSIPEDLLSFTPHQQRNPRNRMDVKNLAVPLQLVTSKHYHSMLTHLPRNFERQRLAMRYGADGVLIPSHIEQLLYFRHIVWPWIQKIAGPGIRDAFKYVANNYPSNQAINTKVRSIRESQEERNRRRLLQEQAEQRRLTAQEQLRQRLIDTFGENAQLVQTEEQTLVVTEDTHIGTVEHDITERVRRVLERRGEDDPEIPF